jgi:hypothetical protein
MKGELEQKDEAYARAHDDLCVESSSSEKCFSLRLNTSCPSRYEAASGLEDDMSAVYRMLSSLASYDAGATVTVPDYE